MIVDDLDDCSHVLITKPDDELVETGRFIVGGSVFCFNSITSILLSIFSYCFKCLVGMQHMQHIQ